MYRGRKEGFVDQFEIAEV